MKHWKNDLAWKVSITVTRRCYQLPDKGQLWCVDTSIKITPYRWHLRTSFKKKTYTHARKFQKCEIPRRVSVSDATCKIGLKKKKKATSVDSARDKGNIMKSRKWKTGREEIPTNGGEEDWRSNPCEVQTAPKASDGIKEKRPGTPNKLRQNWRRGSSLPNSAPPWLLSDRLKDLHKHNPGGLHIDGTTAPASSPVVVFCIFFSLTRLPFMRRGQRERRHGAINKPRKQAMECWTAFVLGQPLTLWPIWGQTDSACQKGRNMREGVKQVNHAAKCGWLVQRFGTRVCSEWV